MQYYDNKDNMISIWSSKLLIAKKFWSVKLKIFVNMKYYKDVLTIFCIIFIRIKYCLGSYKEKTLVLFILIYEKAIRVHTCMLIVEQLVNLCN